MKIRFLIDENLSPKLKKAVLHLNPDLDILLGCWGAIAQNSTAL